MCYSDAYIGRNDTPEGEKEGSLPKTIRRIERSLANVWNEFDVIVVSGLSGVIPGAIIAYMYGKQLVVIRKDDDITHGVRTEGLDGFVKGTPFIVLDDFICRGRTMKRIFDKLEEFEFGMPKYVVLYEAYSWHSVEVGYTEARTIEAHHVAHQLYAPYEVKKERKVRASASRPRRSALSTSPSS